MKAISLDDKYTLERGQIFLSGVQAIVRLALDQHRRDARAGLKTGGFVSGYRGSPLGGVDFAFWQAQALLQANDIVFSPGLNEELAATAVSGTQQIVVSLSNPNANLASQDRQLCFDLSALVVCEISSSAQFARPRQRLLIHKHLL